MNKVDMILIAIEIIIFFAIYYIITINVQFEMGLNIRIFI